MLKSSRSRGSILCGAWVNSSRCSLRCPGFEERSTRLGEAPIRRHESLEHGNNQLLRFDGPLSGLSGQYFTISDKVAMPLCGSSTVNFTDLSSRIGPSFSLVISSSWWREDEIVHADHTDMEARTDRQRWRELQLALNDTLADLVDRVEGTVAEGAGEAVFLIEGKLRADSEQGRKPRRA